MIAVVSKVILSGLLLLLSIIFGIWLSHAGKPLNQFIFTTHKLISTLKVIFLPKEQKHFDRESSKKKADRFHELFKLREFYFQQISEIGLIREISGSESFWFWLVQVRFPKNFITEKNKVMNLHF